MGNVNIKKDAYILTQTGKEIQAILDNVKALNSSDVKELCKLLAEIKDYESGDDSQSIGQQLINALDHMVREDEVQTEVNDSAYPPQSKAVKDVIETHKNAPELDHADGSIKGRHIADNAIVTSQLRDNIITASKLRPNIISENHLSNTLQAKINNAIDEEGLLKYASIISTAPKYKLSDLHRDADIGYDIPGNMDEYFILKNDTSETYDMEILWNEVYSWELTKPICNGKTYLCILRDLVDTGDDVFHDGKIEVVTEMGSDIIDLQTDMQKLIQNTKGTWHYGDTLTHTENSKPVTLDVGAKAGDFYLNIQHFYVYYTQNGTDWTYIGNLTGSVDTSKWAPINSPIFTGTPMADTPSATNNSRQLATTEFVRDAIDKYGNLDVNTWAKLVSPSFTGIPTAPTATTTNNSSQIATTEFVRNAIIRYASGGDKTGNIGNILVPLFLSQVNVTVNIWVSDESPMYIGEITNVTATKSWIAASTPTIDYKTTTWSTTELTDMVLYCQITNVGIYVGICSENNVPYGALTSALPNSVGSTVVTLI